MIAFITNMSTAHNVVANSVTPRQLIEEWIAQEDADQDNAEDFLTAFTVTCVNNQSGINDGNLDTPLAEGSTLSIHTRAVATGGSKGA